MNILSKIKMISRKEFFLRCIGLRARPIFIIGNTQFIVVAQRDHQESQAVIRYASFKLAIKGIAGEFFQRVFENIMVII